MSNEFPPGLVVLAAFRPRTSNFATQLRSIAEQSLGEFRCIVQVDGPAGPVVDQVQAAVGSDPRFSVVGGGSRVGFYRNFERGIQAGLRTETLWVALSDQDDRWYGDKLSRLVPLLSEHALVTGQARVCAGTNATEVTRRRLGTLDDELADNQVTGSFAVFRAELLDLALPFPLQRAASYHDHWLGVCAYLAGGAKVLDVPLQDYIQHSDNVIGEPSRRGWRERVSGLGSPREAGSVLRDRYAVRADMARALLDRLPQASPERTVLADWAAGGRPAARRILASARRGGCPPSRAAALTLGALMRSSE